MSVLLELSIFPVDQGAGLSRFVASVVELVARSGHAHQLTAMGTIVETATLPEALALIEGAYERLEQQGCRRVYATAKLDLRDGPLGRLDAKVESVLARLADGRS
jgi:uncharacterized protein (TIGR00106 family)